MEGGGSRFWRGLVGRFVCDDDGKDLAQNLHPQAVNIASGNQTNSNSSRLKNGMNPDYTLNPKPLPLNPKPRHSKPFNVKS